MLWQDVVIMAACFSLALALIPSIRGTHKPARSSCMLSIICLTALAVCFATFDLWLAFTSEMAGILAWGILFFQKRQHEKNIRVSRSK